MRAIPPVGAPHKTLIALRLDVQACTIFAEAPLTAPQFPLDSAKALIPAPLSPLNRTCQSEIV